MKKIKWIAMLLVCVLLMCNSVCMAENEAEHELFVADTNGLYEDYITSVVALNGQLYMLSNERLYLLSSENAQKQIIVDWNTILSTLNHGQSRAEWLEDFSKTRVDHLISANDAVYGVNVRYGTIFRLDDNQFVTYAVIDPEMSMIADCSGNIFKTDEHLYYLVRSTNPVEEDKLFDYGITEQKVSWYNAGSVYGLVQTNDGVAVLRESDHMDGTLEIAVMNMRTKQFSTLALFPDRNVSGICYSEANDCLLYLQSDTLFTLRNQDANVLGYIPFCAGSLQYEIQLLSTNQIALVSSYGIYIRDVTVDRTDHQTLRLCLEDTRYIPSFIAHHPDIDVLVVDASEVDEQEMIRQLLDGTLDYDVIEINASTLFRTMADKGYLADLSDSSILVADHEQFYPAVQTALYANGKLLGVPSVLVVKSWAYNEELWNELLPDAAPPHTFDELIALCDRWISDIADNDADYCLIYPSAVFIRALYRDGLALYIEEYDQPECSFTFDTEVFRHMLTEKKRIAEAYEMIANRVLISDEGEPLLHSGYDAYLKRDTSSFTDAWSPIMPISLDEQHTPVVSAHMSIYVVNAASEHKPEAVSFLEFVALNRTNADEHLLKPSINTPVQRVGFNAEYAALQNNIEYLYSQLDSSDESARRDIENTIALQESLLANSEATRWQISEEEIMMYRQIAEHMQIRQTALARLQYSTGLQFFYDTIERFVEGNIDMPTCINLLNERINMILNE